MLGNLVSHRRCHGIGELQTKRTKESPHSTAYIPPRRPLTPPMSHGRTHREKGEGARTQSNHNHEHPEILCSQKRLPVTEQKPSEMGENKEEIC